MEFLEDELAGKAFNNYAVQRELEGYDVVLWDKLPLEIRLQWRQTVKFMLSEIITYLETQNHLIIEGGKHEIPAPTGL